MCDAGRARTPSRPSPHFLSVVLLVQFRSHEFRRAYDAHGRGEARTEGRETQVPDLEHPGLQGASLADWLAD